ncbi:hypothetical protein C0J52_01403 [Blattella germanica]|nr:hypothetical protein C0J52_01403 [Blattella germanica]
MGDFPHPTDDSSNDCQLALTLDNHRQNRFEIEGVATQFFNSNIETFTNEGYKNLNSILLVQIVL